MLWSSTASSRLAAMAGRQMYLQSLSSASRASGPTVVLAWREKPLVCRQLWPLPLMARGPWPGETRSAFLPEFSASFIAEHGIAQQGRQGGLAFAKGNLRILCRIREFSALPFDACKHVRKGLFHHSLLELRGPG